MLNFIHLGSPRFTKFVVSHQGAPIVNQVILVRKSFGLAALELDLKSKYCDVGAHISGCGEIPGISIEANERSLHLDESKSQHDFTVIEFPNFKGWDIWATSSGRYSIQIALIKSKR